MSAGGIVNHAMGVMGHNVSIPTVHLYKASRRLTSKVIVGQ